MAASTRGQKSLVYFFGGNIVCTMRFFKFALHICIAVAFFAETYAADELSCSGAGFKVGAVEITPVAYSESKKLDVWGKNKEGGLTEYSCDSSKLSLTVSKIKKNKFRVSSRWENKDRMRFFYKMHLPDMIYQPKCVFVDGKPASYGDHGPITSLKVELVDGVIVFSGPMSLKLYRKYSWPSFQMFVEVEPIEIDGGSDIKISYRPNDFFFSDIDKNLLTCDAPKYFAGGLRNIQWVDFSIPRGKAAMLNAGESLQLKTPKYSRYLYLLASVDSFADADRVFDVEIKTKSSYRKHKLTANDIGLADSAGKPGAAALAWSSNADGKPVSVYIVEVPVQKGAIERVAIKANSQMKIYAATFSRNSLKSKFADQSVETPSQTYKPVEFKRPFKAGSALDMSWVLDAPAGKYGRVVSRGGDLYFSSKPAKRVRFYGANICMGVCVASKPSADVLAVDFARRGYNIVRFHHFDRFILNDGGRKPGVNAAALDRMFYVFAKLKERGVYSTLDLFTMRQLPSGSVPGFSDDELQQDAKGILMFTKEGREMLCEFAKTLLCTKNPYTGMALKDDPSLISVSIVNENTIPSVYRGSVWRLLHNRYKKYLEQNKLSDTKLREAEFLKGQYMQYYKYMYSYLRKLGLKALITDQNFMRSAYQSTIASNYDIVDTHSYFDHPGFPIRQWRYPQYFSYKNALSSYGGSFMPCAYNMIYGKPFSVTEWDYLQNGQSGPEGAFIVSANAAFQGMDMICRFTYSHDEGAITQNWGVGGFDIAGDPLRAISDVAGATLFLRGDVAQSRQLVPFLIPQNPFSDDSPKARQILSESPLYSCGGNYADLSGVVGMSTIVYRDKNSIELPPNAVAAVVMDDSLKLDVPTFMSNDKELLQKISALKGLNGGMRDESKKLMRSSTSEILFDAKNLSYKVITPKSEVFAAQAAAKLGGKFAQVEMGGEKSVVMLTSLDNLPLEKSKRILVLYLTRITNTNMRRQGKTLVIDGGQLPLLMRVDSCKLALDADLSSYKLYALDTDGTRMCEVPLEVKGGRTLAELNNYPQGRGTFAFELVKE